MKRDGWTFLTNHGHVLLCLAKDPEITLRNIASSVEITERAVQQIVSDLEWAGVIVRTRVGRRNRYLVRRDEQFRHPVEAGVTIGDLVDVVQRGSARRGRTPTVHTFPSAPITVIRQQQAAQLRGCLVLSTPIPNANTHRCSPECAPSLINATESTR